MPSDHSSQVTTLRVDVITSIPVLRLYIDDDKLSDMLPLKNASK